MSSQVTVNPYLITTDAGFKIQIGYIHFLQTERTFNILLISKNSIKRVLNQTGGGPIFTYNFIIAPVRVLDPRKDMRFRLGNRKPGMNNRRRKRMM